MRQRLAETTKSLLIQRLLQVSDPKQPVKLPRRGGRRAES
ncbi:hypothetical protein ALP25_102294 [Pseudomonas syringae pv. syringae]|uniref:Uncharacterized protein n=1 Tax=Pseudomonas amygdali pv. morsprunorum TaxID=129138 RepID=A0A3M2W9C1_PSEA0|nr:hypothetical protein ALQ94_102471 [Pseudomonas amygdali pv. morsprunorum]RMU63624.1 hypothetical protein ALP25_102294 [Pseudomonas syringae pv. syringae]